MLRAYVFQDDKNNWIESEEVLLYHDLCAILDDEEKVIYLWNGPKSTKEKLEKGYESVEQLVSNIPDASIQLTTLTEDIPPAIQKKIDKMLESIKKEEEEDIVKFSRIGSIKLYFIFSIVSIILPFITLLVMLGYVWWPAAEEKGYLNITPDIYDLWIGALKIFIIIMIVLFFLNIIIGCVERDSHAVLIPLMGLIVCIGILTYLNQGIFLFLFHEDSTSDLYIISGMDLEVFFLINLVAILVFTLPNMYNLFKFFKMYRDYLF